MSQDPTRPKEKLYPHTHNAIVVDMPMVRDYSTGGGHTADPFVVEGDLKIATPKWQGYPPENLNIIGKPIPPMAQVAIPRYTGKAEYATRIMLPGMIYAMVLGSPHPRARIVKIDASRAEKMRGVAYVLTLHNAPKTYPLPSEPFFQGDVVAIVAADTEDHAEDALEHIDVEYEVLPHASTLAQAMAANPPDLKPRGGTGTLVPAAQREWEWGSVEKGFAEADIIKEFTYYYASGKVVPMQPCGSIATWDGDKLTLYGMSQGIYPQRAGVARGLGIDVSKVRYINKWNGGSFGGARQGSEKFYPWVAWISKQVGKPVKLMLPKHIELAHMQVKPENRQTFKVGVKKDGLITAVQRTFHVNGGDKAGTGGGTNAYSSGGRSELYVHVIPNWKDIGHSYKTNSMTIGPSRSNMQQEFKWGWEQMMDETAEAIGMDPVAFRRLNLQKPGTVIQHRQGGPTIIPMPESENGTLKYDCYASKEVLDEGVKAIGWEQRNAKPGANPGRFKRGLGVAMSQHHAGRVGYQQGEPGFDFVRKNEERQLGGGGEEAFNAEIVLRADGKLVLHFAQPDSGTNHATAMSAQVSEILGYTDLSHVVLEWGDSDHAPSAPGWNSGLTTQLQGGALNNAADRLRKELLTRAAAALKVDAATLQIRAGVISTKTTPTKRTTFAALAKANTGGEIRQVGACTHPGAIGRSMNRGVGACFLEVEVDTYTGDYKILRAAYCHDAGKIVNPLLGEADMHGSLMQSLQVAMEAIPWDREFQGTRHYSVGYLSFRLPTIYEDPEQTHVFINSLEPRWFFGCKGFAETAIGAPPGALANAIYNACGVRIREHPISKEKIMAGLKANAQGGRA